MIMTLTVSQEELATLDRAGATFKVRMSLVSDGATKGPAVMKTKPINYLFIN